MLSGRYSLWFLCAFTLGMAGMAQADWPQWRGANRDGRVPAGVLPAIWPEKLTSAWTLEVGLGHASPLVVGERVYQFSRQGEEEVARCLDLTSGREIWRQGYAAPYKVHPAARSHGPGPKSTPVIAGGRLFTLGISGILSAWKIEDGQRLWSVSFDEDFEETSPTYGAAMSPIVVGDKLIAHVGGHDSGGLWAFDVKSGEPVWKWNEDAPGYSSPVVAELAGQQQLFTQSQNLCLSIDPADGSKLWSLPFTTAYDQNSVTPIVYGETVIFSGLDKATFAVRPTTPPETVWSNEELPMYMSSPVLSGDYLYGLSHKRKGQFFCLDARTGETKWTSRGREGENAAMVADDKFIVALTTDARLHVLKVSPDSHEPVQIYDVAETDTWAHPAFVAGKMLVKDVNSLTLWNLGE